MSDITDIDLIEKRFEQRYKTKKKLNLVICAVIALLGTASVMFIFDFDNDGLYTFRWMTVDGTLYTTIISYICFFVNIVEIRKYTELTSRAVYYMRLSSAVAEGLIITVVLISQLPFTDEHMHIFRFDMFNMHILIPLLTILSFIMNDSPIGFINRIKRLNGTWFITVYAVVIVSFILGGKISDDMIPYEFLDIVNMSAGEIIGCLLVIYTIGYCFSNLLYRLNKKISFRMLRVTGR
ncbi:MAG: hypothetical protein IJL90_03785 [Lachnospiraceae bacterium]|nr:hypothetical protein [Lachnospiraceae bacterium]